MDNFSYCGHPFYAKRKLVDAYRHEKLMGFKDDSYVFVRNLPEYGYEEQIVPNKEYDGSWDVPPKTDWHAKRLMAAKREHEWLERQQKK